jgi:hypothetical protein
MPATKPLVKVIIPLVSLLLLAGFVAYRSGAFDRYIGSTGNNAATSLSYISDTNGKPPLDTTKPRTIMSSSKSMILIDDKSKTKPAPADSTPKTARKDTIIATADSTKPTIFYGSKSGGIVRPADIEKIKVKKKKKNPAGNNQ